MVARLFSVTQIFAWCQGCEDCPDSGEAARAHMVNAMCLLQWRWISELQSQFLDFRLILRSVQFFSGRSESRRSSSGEPVWNRGGNPGFSDYFFFCGIRFLWLLLSEDGGWRQLSTCP
ncbi:hypothetical protein F2Q68_00044216 [Brassica cretica]|uniref:Uncharacterized protein n=1 Tax=Brassica cretica TaxID=69181 RepID=A0A8S9LM87_BRACR|nr:hypothetical protein F2Q68_00044216 [Brassica cretica]